MWVVIVIVSLENGSWSMEGVESRVVYALFVCHWFRNNHSYHTSRENPFQIILIQAVRIFTESGKAGSSIIKRKKVRLNDLH